MKPAAIFLVAFVMLAVAQTAYFAPQLPERVASHFGAGGRADGSTLRGSLFISYWLLIGVMLLMAFGMSRLIGAFPPSMVNLPHKDYWLAPQHRKETMRYLSLTFAWFSVATLAFLLFVFQLIFQTNLTTSPSLPPATMWPVLVVYFAFIVVWIARMLLHFTRVPSPRPLPHPR